MATYLKNEAQFRPFVSKRQLSTADYRILSKWPCFKLPVSTTKQYQWPHFSLQPSTDILFIVDDTRFCNKCVGCIIADPAYSNADTQTYQDTMILSIAATVERCAVMPAPNKWQFCWALPELSFPPFLNMAIFRASIDTQHTADILHKVCVLLCKRPGILPIPTTLVRLFGFNETIHKPTLLENATTCENTLVDVCIALRMFPRLIAGRTLELRRGYVVIPHTLWMTKLYVLYQQTIYSMLHNVRLQQWIESMTNLPELSHTHPDYPEWRLLHQIRQAVLRKQHQQRLQLVYNTEPPRCMQLFLQTDTWKNQKRYELAYILLSLSRVWGIAAQELAEPYILYMQNRKMPKDRITHVQSILKDRLLDLRYRDKRACYTRIDMDTGISCPYGGGRDGVQQCLATRSTKDGLQMDPATATISHVWSHSRAISQDSVKTSTA